MGYGKIFESLFTGSMVGSGPTVFAVWSYVIANAKPPGTIELNPIILATVIGCPPEEIEKAIAYLCAPDERSRTPDHQGKRLLREGNFLFSVPTWEKYNKIRNEIERRASNREAQKRWREKNRKPVSAYVSDGENASAPSAHEEVEEHREVDPVQKESTRSARAPRREAEKPESVPDQVWSDWVAHRKGKRAGVTATALAGIEREAGKAGISLADALAHSVAQGWQGFQADWYLRKNGSSNGAGRVSIVPKVPPPDYYADRGPVHGM